MCGAIAILVGTCLVLIVGSFAVLVLQESRHPRVICLMYHRLCARHEYERVSGTERIFTLPVDSFEQQIAHLKEAGYAFVSPEQVTRFAAGETELPQPAVMITFDDGAVSVYEFALSVLRKHGASATVFVTTDPESYVFQTGDGGQRRMTDDELRELAGVIQVGSHAVTHRPLRALPDAQLRQELAESRQRLEAVVGSDVEYLAIPGNWFDHRVMQLAREVGYKAVWCSNVGTIRVGSELYGLPRVNVEGSLTMPQFIAAIRPTGVAQRRMVSWVKRTPSRLLGPRLWLPLRKLFLACIPGHHISTRRILVALGAFAAIALAVLAWLVLTMRG